MGISTNVLLLHVTSKSSLEVGQQNNNNSFSKRRLMNSNSLLLIYNI